MASQSSQCWTVNDNKAHIFLCPKTNKQLPTSHVFIHKWKNHISPNHAALQILPRSRGPFMSRLGLTRNADDYSPTWTTENCDNPSHNYDVDLRGGYLTRLTTPSPSSEIYFIVSHSRSPGPVCVIKCAFVHMIERSLNVKLWLKFDISPDADRLYPEPYSGV